MILRVPSLPALLCLAIPLALAAGCSGDDDVADEDIILLDESSDEVVLTLRDLLDRGEVVTDDEVAARLTAPADGDTLPADSAPTLTWEPRQSNLRHGRETGEFVWIHVEGPGMDAPIDLAAIETTSWTVDAESWERLRASTGPCTVRVISAYVDRGIVEEGPFQPSESPSFSVIE
jgi:hypothetical protein